MPNAGQWATGIGTGAATGAATGSVFGPWGTVIGGALGAAGGAIATGLSGSDAEEERRKALAAVEQDAQQRKRAYLINLLRQQAGAAGIPTTGLDAQLAAKGFDTGPARQQIEQAYQRSQELSPSAFVPMAQALGTAASNTYRSLQQPAAVMPSQMQAPPQQQPPGGYQEPYYLDSRRFHLTGGFR